MESETQKITNQILIDAREDAKSIVIEARKEAEMMIEEQRELGRQKAAERVTSILRKAKDEADVARGMVFTSIRRKAGWMVLSEKEQIVRKVLDEAKSRLTALTRTERYVSELERLIVDAGISLGGGELEVVLNEHDSDLPINLKAVSKVISEKTDSKTQLELSSKWIKASGGVVVRRADGRVILDNTFEDILRRLEGDLRLKVAKILFR